MTKDELIALAKEAGAAQTEGYEVLYHTMNPEALERFANLVAAKEREECYHAVRGASLRLDSVALTATQTLAIYEQLSAPIRARKP